MRKIFLLFLLVMGVFIVSCSDDEEDSYYSKISFLFNGKQVEFYKDSPEYNYNDYGFSNLGNWTNEDETEDVKLNLPDYIYEGDTNDYYYFDYLERVFLYTVNGVTYNANASFVDCDENFHITIDVCSEERKIISGTFYGNVFDEDGFPYTIEEGKFISEW